MWSNWSIKKNTQNTRTQRSLSIFVNVSRIPAATFRGVVGVWVCGGLGGLGWEVGVKCERKVLCWVVLSVFASSSFEACKGQEAIQSEIGLKKRVSLLGSSWSFNEQIQLGVVKS